MEAKKILEDQLTAMTCEVDRFHRHVIDLPIVDPPGPLPPDRAAFRASFLEEELGEYRDALASQDLPGQIDALVDLVYVAIGALLEMGIDPLEAFRPVQEANMMKVRGETRRGHGYDAQKPDGWKPPDHEAVIRSMAARAKIHPAFLECQEIMNQRSAVYNKGSVRRADHFPLGHVSFFDIVWLKAMRLRSDVEAGIAAGGKFDIDRDHPRDLINYCAFWLAFIDGKEV